LPVNTKAVVAKSDQPRSVAEACAFKSRTSCAIERYLRTGDAGMDARAWPGDFMERRQDADLRAALIAEVHRLAKGYSHEPVPAIVGIEFTRAKVEPMVRRLFVRAEHDVVLATFEKSVAMSRVKPSSRSS